MASDRGKSVATSTTISPSAASKANKAARSEDGARASQTIPPPANSAGSSQQTLANANPDIVAPTPINSQTNQAGSACDASAQTAIRTTTPTTTEDLASPATPATTSSAAIGPNTVTATQIRPTGVTQAGTARGARPNPPAVNTWPQGWEQFPGCFDPQFQTSLVWTRDGSGRPRPQYPPYWPSQVSTAPGPSRPRAVTPISTQDSAQPAASGPEGPMSTERLAAKLAGFARRQEELLNTIMGRIDRQEQNISTRLTALSRPSEPLNSSGRRHSPILAGGGTQSREYPVVALNYEETPVSQAPVLSSSATINDDPQNNGINPRNDHSLQQTENRGAGGGEDAQQEQLPLPPPIPPHDGSQPAQWLGSSAFATSSGQESARPRAVSFQPSDRLGGITFPAQANPDRYQSWGPGNGRNADMEFLRQGLAQVSSRLHRATSSAPEIDRVVEETRLNPFTDRISSSHIRDIGKIKLPEYPGMGDPKAHVRAFRLAIARTHLTYNEQDAGYCRLFAKHLTGPAMEWFSRLRPGSVNSFEQLVTLFLKQYSIFIEHTASEADLWRLTQGPNESLRSYLTRFKEVKSKIANPNNELALEALKNGLRYRSEYRRDLTVNISASLEDALHRGLKFALAEEEDLALAPQQG